MERHEKPFHVAIEPTLSHLIGLDLNEGVVSAFGPRGQLQRSKLAHVGPRPRRRGVLSESYLRKKLIGGRENIQAHFSRDVARSAITRLIAFARGSKTSARAA